LSSEAPSRQNLTWLGIFILVDVPGIALRLSGTHLDPIVAAIVFGIGIIGGAFLLSWAAEVAQVGISASLAIAVLALIAILPEYTIEAILDWKAGAPFDPALGLVTPEMELVAANVTGSNRLLVGLGCPVVILIFWAKRRKILDLRGQVSLELMMLIVATVLTFLMFFMGQLHIALAILLVALYLLYLSVSSTKESGEPELIGVGAMSPPMRRTAAVGLLAFAATVILASAEPFVESLVEVGGELGIDEFILIQWIATLASESPKINVATLFALRSNPHAVLTTLISEEVNQLSILIGSMAIVFSLSAGEVLSFPLESRQLTELLLTSSVSAFAIVLLAPKMIGWRAGAVLFGLFLVHLLFPNEEARRAFTYVYLVLAVAMIVWNWRQLPALGGDRGWELGIGTRSGSLSLFSWREPYPAQQPGLTVEWVQHVVGDEGRANLPDSKTNSLAATAHERCDQLFE
jgi:cation:H+ antiporter